MSDPGLPMCGSNDGHGISKKIYFILMGKGNKMFCGLVIIFNLIGATETPAN
jgi:hypothetical protein